MSSDHYTEEHSCHPRLDRIPRSRRIIYDAEAGQDFSMMPSDHYDLLGPPAQVTQQYENHPHGANLYAAQAVDMGMRPAIEMSRGGVDRIVIGD